MTNHAYEQRAPDTGVPNKSYEHVRAFIQLTSARRHTHAYCADAWRLAYSTISVQGFWLTAGAWILPEPPATYTKRPAPYQMVRAQIWSASVGP